MESSINISNQSNKNHAIFRVKNNSPFFNRAQKYPHEFSQLTAFRTGNNLSHSNMGLSCHQIFPKPRTIKITPANHPFTALWPQRQEATLSYHRTTMQCVQTDHSGCCGSLDTHTEDQYQATSGDIPSLSNCIKDSGPDSVIMSIPIQHYISKGASL